jgi:Phytanoyl-CoA dioxygenase (PhyH)
MKNPGVLYYTARLAIGMLEYSLCGRTPDPAYQSMIGLFCRTGGRSNEILSRVISLLNSPYHLEKKNGLLGDIQDSDFNLIEESLNKKGYYVFDQVIPPEMCERLLKFSENTRCRVRPMSDKRKMPPKWVDRYDRRNLEGVRYDFAEEDVVNNVDVQALMTDRAIIRIAQDYLRCRPIFDVMSMWWHTSYSKQPDADAAQYYHFDMDRIKWLKIFIYLTDVTEKNGPHCFVEGSHRIDGIPQRLLANGYSRLSDEDVQASYPPEKLIEFTGRRGTVIFEDTRGLHKGKHVLQGERLILQLQLSNSLFGGYYPVVRIGNVATSEFSKMIERYPSLYSAYINNGA